jgi:hypothetical protein
VRFFVDLSDARRPVKCEIVREGYLPPFEPGPRAAGVTALEPADLMATKLLANADRGLDRALRFRDFLDLVMAASEWPQQAPLAMEKAVGAYRESAMSSVEKVADLLREEAYGRLAMSDKARVLIDQVLGISSPGTISRIFGR